MALAMAFAVCPSVREEFGYAARTPLCTSALTWSFIRLMSGDTTSVMPGSSSAGNW